MTSARSFGIRVAVFAAVCHGTISDGTGRMWWSSFGVEQFGRIVRRCMDRATPSSEPLPPRHGGHGIRPLNRDSCALRRSKRQSKSDSIRARRHLDMGRHRMGPGGVRATSPPPRWDATLAYNPTTRTLVLFGGQSFDRVFGDTWTWNGTTWTEQHPAMSRRSPRISRGNGS